MEEEEGSDSRCMHKHMRPSALITGASRPINCSSRSLINYTKNQWEAATNLPKGKSAKNEIGVIK